VPSSALATALRTAGSSVTRLVDKLEAAEFVARGSPPTAASVRQEASAATAESPRNIRR
jgi:DNA-binding MarR family transcriptional regulator